MFKKQILLLLILALPLYGATLSEEISKIEKIIQQDPGNRGVSHFYTTALFDAAESLEKANHVAILTGFFIPSAQRPETDGPLGTVFLAEALIALGKKVTIVTDRACLDSIDACVDLIKDRFAPPHLNIAIFPEEKRAAEHFVKALSDEVDCLVSIERVGRSFDGKYRSMRAIDISANTAPLDDLFIYAQEHPERHITTIAVGDGGNEIGMGEKIEEVKQYVLNGEAIACVVPADHLIVTGVSNWGGYALAGALYCIALENRESAPPLDSVYPTEQEQFQMLENMIAMNCCDGVTGKSILCVDGLSWEFRQKIIEDIRQIIFSCS